jgi:hypothetical protein
MANMRMEGKKLQTLWLLPIEKERLIKLAKHAGMNISDFLKRPITESLAADSKKTK